jgi:hypothetical protein
MASRLKHTVTSTAGNIVLYGDTAIIKKFFPTAVAVTAADNPTVVANYKARKRRRYPGGKETAVRAADYERVTGVPAKLGVLPGNPIKCEEKLEDGPPAKWKVYQITLVGSFTKAYKVAQATATRDYILRSPQGRPNKISGSLNT